MKTQIRTQPALFFLMGCLAFSVQSSGATTATWLNTANGTNDVWVKTANWNAAQYPGQDAANQNAYLTNRVSGSVYKAVVDTPLPYPVGIVEVKNQGAGGEAWVLVTNAVFAATNLLIRTGGRLQVDNGCIRKHDLRNNINDSRKTRPLHDLCNGLAASVNRSFLADDKAA